MHPTILFLFSLVLLVGAPRGEASPDGGQPATPTSNPLALQVISNAINVLGGEEAWRAVENVVFRGQEKTRAHTYETHIFKTSANQVRIERFGRLAGRNLDFHWVATADAAWNVEVFRNRPLVSWFTDEERQALLFENALYPLFFDYERRGIRFELIAWPELGGSSPYHIRAFFPTGKRVEFYFHSRTFRLIRQSYLQRTENGTEMRSIEFDAYALSGGVYWPKKLRYLADEREVSTWIIERIATNQTFPSDLFVAPEKKEAGDAKNQTAVRDR